MKDNTLIFNWQLINNHLDVISSQIFEGYDKNTLTSLQKRFIIFNYLVNHYEYDWELYDRKCDYKVVIHPHESMIRLITKRKGLCSSLTPIYKFLLERENIPAICCYCNIDDFANQHMILLVKDENNWSFDDVSVAIIGEDSMEKLFGYDCFAALKLQTLQKKIAGVSSEVINSMYYKPMSIYKDEKISDNPWLVLPPNIKKLPINIVNSLINTYYKKEYRK